ncbi:MAG TPA: alkaline phosphatase family protein, partial [Thermoplasmata archaeon]|nr:alkaline phosphatase family protein [Thermoplasmata archaeon]
AAMPPLAPSVDPFHGRRAEGPVLLFVVDGLGYERLRLRSRRDGGAMARDWLAHAVPITSVFPTTTTVALASLSTATSPSRHGLVGYRQFLPQFGAVVDILRMSPHGVAQDDALLGPAWTPSVVLGAPTIFREGVPNAVAVSRDRFEGRGFTRMIYDGAAYEPYATWSDLPEALVHVLGGPSPPPLVVGYWDELDAIQHLRGPAAASVDLELDRLAVVLDFVARSVGPKAARATTVLVTADHGLVPADPASQTWVDAEPTIAGHLALPPTGDRRVGLLKARTGEVDALREAVVDRMPQGTRVLASSEAVRGGLFGPPPYHPELLERVTDLVVLVPSPGGITFTLPGRKRPRRSLLGAHGGLEAEELVVPLVSGPLDQFRLPGTD